MDTSRRPRSSSASALSGVLGIAGATFGPHAAISRSWAIAGTVPVMVANAGYGAWILLAVLGMDRLGLISLVDPTIVGSISLVGIVLNGAAWVVLGLVVLRPARRAGGVVAAALLVVAGVTACMAAPPPFVPPASVRPFPAADAVAAPMPVIVDTDLDADDLLALMVLLSDPAVEVRAIAITGTGLAHCAPGLVTVDRLLIAFDAASIPVACGREDPGTDGHAFPAEWRAAADAAYGLVASLPSDPGSMRPASGAAAVSDLYRDVVGAAGDGVVSVVALGPWTNLEDAFGADPTLATRIRVIHAMLGTIDAPGNTETGAVDPGDGVEWNAAADPSSVAFVLGLDVPVVLVPLDATDNIPVPRDIATRLEAREASAAVLVARELYARSPSLAGAGRYWWDPLAALTFADPTLVGWEDLGVVVDTSGDSAGRLRRSDAGRLVRAAMRADPAEVTEALLGALERGLDRR